MPFKTDKKALNSPFLDRRVKLLPCQKERIIRLYATGDYSQRGLADMFNVNKKCIHLLVNPEAVKKQKAGYHARGGWKNYYKGGEEWAAVQREHRRYKYNTLTQKNNEK